MTEPRLGFIGFGEAGTGIARGLVEEGLQNIVAYDIRERPAVDGVRMVDGMAALAAEADMLIAAVTCDVARPVAEEASAHLGTRHLYVDINSVAPETKIGIGDVIDGTGARFVEAAVMAAVPPNRHKVPILLAGEAASDVITALGPYGMNLEDIGPERGQAAATKMLRSIMVKGLEALLLECVLAAEHYGVAEKVLASVGDGYPGVDWKKLADHFAGRTAIHGERRAHEMEEVAAMLESLGIEPFMAKGAADRIRWGGSFGLKEIYGDAPPKDFHEVLAAIRARQGK